MKKHFLLVGCIGLFLFELGFLSPPVYGQIPQAQVYPAQDFKSTDSGSGWRFEKSGVTHKFLSTESYQTIRARLKQARKRQYKRASKTQVGDIHSFYVRDVLQMDRWHQAESICLYASDELALWMTQKDYQQFRDSVDIASITDQLSQLLETSAPAMSVAPQSGILDIVHSFFGAAPDIDHDGVLDILLLDIQDNFESTGSYVAGFFDPVNLIDDPHSNYRDLIYVDLYPSLFYQGELNINRVASTIAHEYQHLIHANYEGDDPQYVFINEGLSELSEILCGFEPRPADAYFNDSVRPLLSWNHEDPLPDYARASLFMHYLFEQTGYDHIHELVQTQTRGMQALEEVINQYSSLTFQQLFVNWGKAMLINDRSDDPAWGYNDLRRASVRFTPRYIYSELPEGAFWSLPALVHLPLLFPLTSSLSFRSHAPASGLQFSAVASYPEGTHRPIATSGNTMKASDSAFGSMEVLISDIHPQTEEQDTTVTPYNFLAQGEKSGVTLTQAYDDGIADTFTGNASYLLLDGTEEEAYAVAFGGGDAAWLYAISLKGIFLNELEGSDISPEAVRDVQIQIYSWQNSRPGKALTQPLVHAFQRPLGNLKFEQVSLLEEYPNLSALQDSFCVVIQNDADDANFFAVGMDQSETGHTYVADSESGQWQSMDQLSVGGTPMNGWNAMIRAGLVVEETPVPAALYPRVEVDHRAVTVRFDPPFAADTTRSACFAALPDGSVVEGVNDAAFGTGLTYSFPVQTGGSYHFYARMIADDGRRVSRSNWTWAIPEERRFEVYANYPNPFNLATTVPFTLLEDGTVRADVFNIIGQKIQTVSRSFAAGRRNLRLDLSGRASGVYLIRLRLSQPSGRGELTKTQKIMLIK